jgi:hypothetical protein
VIASGVLALALVAGCGDGEEVAPAPPPAEEPTTQEPPAPPETQPPAETEPPAAATTDGGAGLALPPAVERTRDAIVDAARAFDYEALAALLDPATFSYSFGESGDPIGYWRTLEEEGEVPILGDFLPVVLSMHVGKQDDVYVWPAAHAKEPSAWTEEDLADMRQLYTDEEIRGFEDFGGYAGYRVGIREDGTWLFFVAGD